MPLAGRSAVYMRRCAWHPRYRGYPVILGVASWRGRGLRYTDGICRSCALHVRRDARAPGADREAVPLALPPAAVFLIILGLGLFAAVPSHHAPAPLPPGPVERDAVTVAALRPRLEREGQTASARASEAAASWGRGRRTTLVSGAERPGVATVGTPPLVQLLLSDRAAARREAAIQSP